MISSGKLNWVQNCPWTIPECVVRKLYVSRANLILYCYSASGNHLKSSTATQAGSSLLWDLIRYHLETLKLVSKAQFLKITNMYYRFILCIGAVYYIIGKIKYTKYVLMICVLSATASYWIGIVYWSLLERAGIHFHSYEVGLTATGTILLAPFSLFLQLIWEALIYT